MKGDFIMGKILDDPKKFFDDLSTDQFENLLDEFGFKYTKEETPELTKNVINCIKRISVNNCFFKDINNIEISSNIKHSVLSQTVKDKHLNIINKEYDVYGLPEKDFNSIQLKHCFQGEEYLETPNGLKAA